jgi:hypothetical protein
MNGGTAIWRARVRMRTTHVTASAATPVAAAYVLPVQLIARRGPHTTKAVLQGALLAASLVDLAVP